MKPGSFFEPGQGIPVNARGSSMLSKIVHPEIIKIMVPDNARKDQGVKYLYGNLLA